MAITLHDEYRIRTAFTKGETAASIALRYSVATRRIKDIVRGIKQKHRKPTPLPQTMFSPRTLWEIRYSYTNGEPRVAIADRMGIAYAGVKAAVIDLERGAESRLLRFAHTEKKEHDHEQES